MAWTPDTVEQLKVLWSQGLSITQIGKQLGMTRNAVVGKAHRIGLEKRTSPIVRRPRPAAPIPAPLPQPVLHTGAQRCQWPIGDPKTSEFRFCGKSALPGRPYCDDHCSVAYTSWTSEDIAPRKQNAA
ncbi:GcrA family cell cycle regulator [Marinibaculum pumilum]|uniref:GcrA family cell cycle regulator n=1 Tax=Marinibaculum pumilum TaxID=1766165 RepID=A0ABV7L931_9PROT